MKYDQAGNVSRYKARLVARGFTQVEGKDYEETYSPVPLMSTVRMLLQLIVELRMKCTQDDIDCAFVNARLKEEIYMEQPELFELDSLEGMERLTKKDIVCYLVNALHGLKQASRAWFETITELMLSNGFQQSTSDPCLFTKVLRKGVVYVLVYVDDIIIAAPDDGLINDVREMLRRRFKTKNMTKLEWYLGMRVERYFNGEIHLSQESYIDRVLERFEMAKCKPRSIPMNKNLKLSKEMCPKTEDKISEMKNVPYRQAVGAIMYIMVTLRPDICFYVSEVSRYLENPGSMHWNVVKSMLRYLKGTKDYGLMFRKIGHLNLVGYCDSSWSDDVDNSRSTGGYVFYLGGTAISWKTKEQTCVAMSSAEAEYIALSEASKEALYLMKMVQDMHLELKLPIVIYEDNQSCIALVKRGTNGPKSKHIRRRYHFVRELVKEGLLEVIYKPTEEMIADALTKSLGKEKLSGFRKKMGVMKRPGQDTNDAEKTVSQCINLDGSVEDGGQVVTNDDLCLDAWIEDAERICGDVYECGAMVGLE